MDTKDEGSTPASEGSANGNNENSNYQAEIEQLRATNKRLLEESKGFKEKYKSVSEQVEEKEKKVLLEKGDLQKLLEMERNKLGEITNREQKLREEVLKTRIQSVVSKYAVGVVDLDDLLNQPKYSHILKEGVDVESLTVSEESAKTFVEALRKDKSYLFKANNQPGAVTKKPGMTNGASKNPSQMTQEELIDAWKNLV